MTSTQVFNERRVRDQSSSDDQQTTCPICLDELQDACETSCGHLFCGKCLTDYWNSLPRNSPKICPLDRRNVTFVIPSHGMRRHVENAAERRSAPSRGQEEDEYNDSSLFGWNQILNEQGGTFDLRENVHLMSRMAFEDEQGSTMRVFILIAFLALFLYTLLPYDLIPDTIPVLGFFDDIFAWIFTFAVILPRLYRLYILSRAFGN